MMLKTMVIAIVVMMRTSVIAAVCDDDDDADYGSVDEDGGVLQIRGR